MVVEIQIFPGKEEPIFPIIKLTKSLNGKTGTATFLFFQPLSFDYFLTKKISIQTICLIKNEKKIESKEISIFFKNGKPFLLKTIFLFKNPNEWFEFFQFMTAYSQEKGFLFS